MIVFLRYQQAMQLTEPLCQRMPQAIGALCLPAKSHPLLSCGSCSINWPYLSYLMSAPGTPDCLSTCCAANTFVQSWTYRVDTSTAASSSGATTTLIGYLAATCSDGSSLTAATNQSQTYNSTYTLGMMQTDATESQYGYSNFDLT